jgi:uncharacterized protein YndB with AHSA1/START domain
MQEQAQTTLPDIIKTSILDASIETVWDTVATSDGIAAWFMPNNFEPVIGQEFHLNAGPWGMSSCKVTEIDPPHRLSFRWAKDWVVTFELKDLGGKTEFALIHSGWKADTETEFGEPHVVVRDRMDHGWTGIQEKLRVYVEA